MQQGGRGFHKRARHSREPAPPSPAQAIRGSLVNLGSRRYTDATLRLEDEIAQLAGALKIDLEHYSPVVRAAVAGDWGAPGPRGGGFPNARMAPPARAWRPLPPTACLRPRPPFDSPTALQRAVRAKRALRWPYRKPPACSGPVARRHAAYAKVVAPLLVALADRSRVRLSTPPCPPLHTLFSP